MTNRINSITVFLEKDVREDDVESLVEAIGNFRNVLSVEKNVSDLNLQIATQRAKRDLVDKLFKVLEPNE